MSYFIMKDNELTFVDTESLPAELEELYQNIRKKYIIEFSCSDWANDTGDAGMGYDYDNSYKLFREPLRREMVIKDGKLAGFYVGCQSEHEATKEYLLELVQGFNVFCGGSSSPRYGDSKEWVLNIKEESAPLEHVCLFWVNEEDGEHTFVPEEFDCKFVDSILNVCRWQDNYGRFDGVFRITLKLTKEGIENPDAVLLALQKFNPILVKA